MKKFVAFNLNNEPSYISTISGDFDINNQVAADCVFKEVMENIDDTLFLKTRYLSNSGEIKVREEKRFPYQVWDKNNEVWTVDLAALKNEKSNQISTACREQIVSGFQSDALGAVHTYPSKEYDQMNLTASVVDSSNPLNTSSWTTPFWCADVNGNWAFAEHTAAQIQKAGSDGKLAISNALRKNAELQSLINAATSEAEINSIVW